MPNIFQGVGNLADAPSIKNITARTGKAMMAAEMRVFFDEYEKNGDGSYAQSGGIWLPVTTYDHTAENCARLLRKGARVKVEGRLTQFEAHDAAGNAVTAFSVVASAVFLSPTRVDSVQFAESRNKSSPNTSDEPPPFDYGEFDERRA
jgi:single-strand DNA-binding protein